MGLTWFTFCFLLLLVPALSGEVFSGYSEGLTNNQFSLSQVFKRSSESGNTKSPRGNAMSDGPH